MNLIVQSAAGTEIETPDLKHLAKLVSASGIESIRSNAFRLRDAQGADRLGAEIAAYCDSRRLDFAWVPESRRLSDFGLLVMDMDSTLISIECIDEVADFHGLKDKIAAITARSMRGELDFAASLRERVELLEGTNEDALSRVYEERLRLSPGADRMLARMREAGVRTLLVSGGFTYFTERLKARLGLDYALSNTLEIEDGRLTGRVVNNDDIVDAQAKLRELVRVRDSLGLKPEQVIGVGDGANDLPFLAEAGVSVAYHAKPVVRAQATHCLNYSGLDGLINLFA